MTKVTPWPALTALSRPLLLRIAKKMICLLRVSAARRPHEYTVPPGELHTGLKQMDVAYRSHYSKHSNPPRLTQQVGYVLSTSAGPQQTFQARHNIVSDFVNQQAIVRTIVTPSIGVSVCTKSDWRAIGARIMGGVAIKHYFPFGVGGCGID